MTTNVSIYRVSDGKKLFAHEEPPRYLPREGELIQLYLKGLFKVIRVVHEYTYCHNVNIFVEPCHKN